ncbi:MAG TPA: CHAT domain-containing protein [Puia sp.]|jgi:pimeloyl-ACP methyl ester carboxylesterase
MRISKLTLNGNDQTPVAAANPDYPTLQLEQSILVSPAVRGIDNKIQLNLTDDHLVELVFEDETTWLCTPDTLEELYPGQLTQQRGGDDSFALPLTISDTRSDRGLLQQIALKVVNLFTKKAAAKGMGLLAEDLEEKQLGKVRGLVRVTNTFELVPFNAGELQGTALLFIHGTNSSSTGSFGELVGTDLWTYATQTYNKNNILAFQHETLTKSPLQNAVELISQLPADIELHFITHSRGGLVGEILARCSDTSQSDIGFSEKEVEYLAKEGRDADVKSIRQLQDLYRQKRFRTGRFIRVACPSGGTTILSKRLDHFFNITLNLIGASTGLSLNPVYIATKNLLTAVIDQKNDQHVLPGLEAMKPDSPFIVVLNNQDTIVNRPVVAISGNCKAKVNFKALLILAEKLFFFEDNDLVVNTKSMYAGSKRLSKLQYFFDEGTDVDHFHYFRNKKTNTAIQLALQAPQFQQAAPSTQATQPSDTTLISGLANTVLISGFTEFNRGGPLTEGQRNALLDLQGGEYSTGDPTGKKPIVILLPGIMGSCLSKDFDAIWLDYWRMLKGALLQLDTSTVGIRSPAIIKTSYQQLGNSLSADYDVVTFPFDWRLSSKDAAGLLEVRIRQLLTFKQPIRLVAHSLGGVVARDLMVFYPETWKLLNASEGFRLIFLGSPLMGSFRIINVLFGEDDIISKLSKLDLLHTKKTLLAMFAKFPGILGLLPLTKEGGNNAAGASNNFADAATWSDMAVAFGDPSWPIPQANNGLNDFGAYRDAVITAIPRLDLSNAVYIAGQFPQTPCGYRIDTDSNNKKELVLLSTAEGDQSVTWDLGIPAVMISSNSVYYVNHSHGDLSNSADMFSGIKELLEKGKTNLFSSIRPTVRGDQKTFRKPMTTDFDLSPEAVERTLLGLSGDKTVKSSQLPLRVSVANGDLKYAAYPVLAGHFEHDSVLYAEKRINQLLVGQLEERSRLGIYPGEIGTCEVVLTYAEDGFQGAIIAGIGDQDKLTAFDLSKTIEQAAAKYLLIVNGRKKLNTGQFKEPIGLSTLVIGCGYGGLSIESSVHGILQGIVNANAKIATLYGEKAKLVEEVEFIEQYQDRALGCFYAINRMGKELGSALNIVPAEDSIRERHGARQKVNIDQGKDWWNRITITQNEDDNGIIDGMKFSISTGAAREELRDLYTSGGVVQSLIESISVDNNWTKEKSAAVFELLMPNDFKSRLKRQGNITWVLDKYTAGFPWELLQHKGEEVKPMCVSAGMIRQLATGNSRVNIELVTADTALVIGDPQLNGFLPQLPGALEEAKTVAEVLTSHGFTTTPLLREVQDTIIPTLMSGSFKIIHLAGHGLFDPDPRKPSGMVIGKDNFLTTRQLAQMSDTPDLVFVNCCFLGKTDAAAEKYYQSRFKLAASIGTQLIENGVKAVVVAGWAVDDKAANRFANTFYRNMFAGKAFGEAVRIAREDVYNNNSNVNTWGAYQCYGNPFYRLKAEGRAPEKKQYVITEQAEIDLMNLESDMRTGDCLTEDLLCRLKSISDETDKCGLRKPIITELEARIYKSLNKYDLALKKYEDLILSEEGGYSFGAVELYCNLRSKLLKERIEKKEPASQLEKEFDQVHAYMEALILLSPTAERYDILGSCWKRRTALYPDNRDQLALSIRKAAGYYRQANQIRARAYPFSNWIALENLLVAAGLQQWGGLPDLPELTVLNKMLTDLEQACAQGPVTRVFEDWIAPSNLKLVDWLIKATAAGAEAADPLSPLVIESYTSVWKKVGSREDHLSDIQHLQLLIDALTGLTAAPDRQQEHFMVLKMRALMEELKLFISKN